MRKTTFAPHFIGFQRSDKTIALQEIVSVHFIVHAVSLFCSRTSYSAPLLYDLCHVWFIQRAKKNWRKKPFQRSCTDRSYQLIYDFRSIFVVVSISSPHKEVFLIPISRNNTMNFIPINANEPKW